MRNSYKILAAELEGNKTLERPKRRWEENSEMDVTETV
jgi:hypothetical protein